jgi:hypothetical protein
MQLIRTTIRLKAPLKQAAEKKALELNVSFQTLLHQALESYLKHESRRKAQRIVFHAQDLGVPLDKLSREDIYAD